MDIVKIYILLYNIIARRLKKIYTFLIVTVLLIGLLLRSNHSYSDLKTVRLNTVKLECKLIKFNASKYNFHYFLSNCFSLILKKSTEKHSGIILIKAVTTEATNTPHKISIQRLVESSFDLLFKSADKFPKFGHKSPPIKPPSFS